MLQEFRKEEILRKLKELARREEELKKIEMELKDAIKLSDENIDKRASIEGKKEYALTVKGKTSIFSKLASLLLHRGKYHEINQQINMNLEELKFLEEEQKKIDARITELEQRQAELKKENTVLPECVQEYNGTVVITETLTGNENKERVKKIDTIPSDQKVLVHCTNFFPKENKILSDYEGGKIVSCTESHNGVLKEIQIIMHRHEVHFTINARVENTGMGEGKWDNPSYIIIDRYDIHENELESVCPSDTWTNGTSVQLSEDAVIMVRIQDKDKLPIPQEEMYKYNIIFYDGDPTKCLRNFLSINNYDIFHTDPNYAGHNHSERKVQEKCGNLRDLAINYVKDNTYFSKEPMTFSEEEISRIIEVAQSIGVVRVNNYSQDRLCVADREITAKQEKSFLDIANFVIGTGMKISKNGEYTFGNDDEIFETIKKLEENKEALPDNVDTDFIYKIFQMYQRNCEKQKHTAPISIDEYSEMTLHELYKFENQLVCEEVIKRIPEGMTMIYEEGTLIIQLWDRDYSEIGKKLKPEDGIEYCDIGYSNELQIKIDGNTRIADLANIIDEYKAKIEQIAERTIEVVGKDDDER